jgi:hypothetical protein
VSWNTLPEDVREMAADTLTEKQLAAFKLELSGLGVRRIAKHLGLATTTAKDRLDRAHTHLLLAGVRQDDVGQWFIQPNSKEAA